jgi:hypothetical protein
MNKFQNRHLISAAAVAVLLAVSAPASAALSTYTQKMSGFSYDSDTVSSAFNTALGSGYTHISFLGATNTNGASYSPDVTFSTRVGAFGGSNTSSVNASNEIGPSGSWDGILNIDFNGAYVSAVGFGLVVGGSAAGTISSIRVFDDTTALIGTFNNQLVDTFSLWGVAASAGERIARLELDGQFFAIQDIEFSANGHNNVPEPESMLLISLGLLGLGATLRRKARDQKRV